MNLEDNPNNPTAGTTEEYVNSDQDGYLKDADGVLTVKITKKDVWDNLTGDIKNDPNDKMYMIKFQNDVDLPRNDLIKEVSNQGSENLAFTFDVAENENKSDHSNSFNVQVNRVNIVEEVLAEKNHHVQNSETQIGNGIETELPEVSTSEIANREGSEIEDISHANRSGTFDSSVFEGIARHSIDVKSNALSEDISPCRKGMIMLFCFLMQCCTGLLYSLGLIYVILLDVFGASRSVTSLVQSLCLAVTYGLGFFMGMIIEKIGLRLSILCGSVFAAIGFAASAFAPQIYYIIICIGIIGGIGISLLTISSFAAIPIYFKDKQNAAVAFTSMGTGIGSAVWPKIMIQFIKEYDWRGNYLLVGGIMFNASVMAMFFKSQKLAPEQKAIAKANRSMKTIRRYFKEMVKNPRFVAYLFWSAFDSFSISVLSQMLVDFGLQLGYNLSDSTALLTYYLLSNAVGRFLVGILNRFKIPHFILFSIFCYMCGASFIALSFTSTYKYSLAFGIASGFTLGLHVAMSMVILLRIVGPEKYGLGWGLSASCLGIGFSCSGPFAGMIADMYSYNMSFFISGIAVIFISTCFSIVVLCTRNTKKMTL
ncbi:monocarboxylate transporter 4 [Octopus bimaculoides]|uniref:Major facilitator superfamily (MFS) profile domain-containing protein n=1 Tax=Octopus bimaculoides TaxID=37653 RepID=A0A0L8HA67_OCTBM|nr:monocarboxylate transporter 4 [Octopus bimaculoides]|eukprot:XP_014774095.1 PREDICTED: monocarboxylate transporter 4-like [Octopus bimaculoides]